MKYIIMCGGKYQQWQKPRQLLEINGETIVERTIRLLREEGIDDIAISTNNEAFDKIGVPILVHHNTYDAKGYNDFKGYWCDAFYPTDEPACYLFGDVIFSRQAIRKIIDTETNDIEFFASAPPFSKAYHRPHAEPFALKVVNQHRFRDCICKVKALQDSGAFRRKPIMWELWQIIKNTPINKIDYTNYTAINDYTVDVDYPEDIAVVLETMENIDYE